MASHTAMDSSGPMRNDITSKEDRDGTNNSPPANATGGLLKQSDSSSDDEHCKSGPSKATQNLTSPQSQKRPMNAFLIFCKRHRSVVREKYPHLENRSITKILGEWWAALDTDQKQKYTELARQYKEAFMKANPHFKWYKTTDIRPPMPLSPPPPPPPVPPPVILSQHSPPSQPQTAQQSTPKPPKKRYLENGEFKGTTNVTTGTTITTPTTTNSSGAGPPILDIDTANRVIENALSGSAFNSLLSNSHGGMSFDSELISGHINSVIEEHANEFAEKSHMRCDDSPPNGQSAASGNSTHNALSTTNHSARISPHHLPSDDDDEDHDDNNDNDKPLNLSSSTVLHTSNQHIIDHFIEKMLNTGLEGNSTPSVLSLPFTANSAVNCQTPTSVPSSISSTTTTSTQNKQNRRERTCKGKRYLEILNENKLAKRNRAVSPSGAGNADRDELSPSKHANQSPAPSISSSSKWVSGGFDLEERIAALPQLGDAHLLNALSNSKANKGTVNNQHNSKKFESNESMELSGEGQKGQNNCGDINCNDMTEKSKNISKLSDDAKLNDSNTPQHHNWINSNVDRESGSRKVMGKDDGRKKSSYCHDNAIQENQRNDCVGSVGNGETAEHYKCQDMRNSQGIECDGLAALAEVALTHARNSIS